MAKKTVGKSKKNGRETSPKTGRKKISCTAARSAGSRTKSSGRNKGLIIEEVEGRSQSDAGSVGMPPAVKPSLPIQLDEGGLITMARIQRNLAGAINDPQDLVVRGLRLLQLFSNHCSDGQHEIVFTRCGKRSGTYRLNLLNGNSFDIIRYVNTPSASNDPVIENGADPKVLRSIKLYLDRLKEWRKSDFNEGLSNSQIIHLALHVLFFDMWHDGIVFPYRDVAISDLLKSRDDVPSHLSTVL